MDYVRGYDEKLSRKVWRQLKREHIRVACCTLESLIRNPGLQGAVRGRTCKTTISDASADWPVDLANRSLRPCDTTNCGWLISPSWRRERVLSMWRSLLMFLPTVLCAGELPIRCTRIWYWTHRNRRYGQGAIWKASYITAIGAASTCQSVTRSDWPKRVWSPW